MTRPLPQRRKRGELTVPVRMALSDGVDFLGDFDHLEPLTRDQWNKVQYNLWDLPPTDGRIVFLRKEWQRHRDAVLAWHINQNRDGSRPWAFWQFDYPGHRPVVAPSNGTPGDSGRHARERKLADIGWLLDHDLMPQAEQTLVRKAEEG